MRHPQIEGIINTLSELQIDQSVPKNIKSKLQEVIELLNGESDLSIRISKALNILEEMADNSNLQSYTRTQMWNIISMLEKV